MSSGGFAESGSLWGYVDVELDAQPARQPLKGAESGLVVASLKSGNGGLLHAQLAGQSSLREPVLNAVGKHAHCDGSCQGRADVLGVHPVIS